MTLKGQTARKEIRALLPGEFMTEDLYKLEDHCHEHIENAKISADFWAEFEEQVGDQIDDEEKQILEYIRKQALIQKRLRRLSRLPSSRLHSIKRNRCRPRMWL
jgi:hypothetical protein